MPPTPVKITEITEAVRNQEQAQDALWKRMDRDYMLWRGDSFIPPDEEGIEKIDVYTSNDFRTMGDKGVAVVAESDLLARVISDFEDKESRDADNNAERLFLGFLADADARLKAASKPDVKSQLAWNSFIRGGHVNARALLKKDADGETVVDITPYDPRNIVAILDENGPIWAAVISERARGTIKKQYPNTKRWDGWKDSSGDSDRIRLLDYWERMPVKRSKEDSKDDSGEALPPKFEWHNGVIVDDRWAKKMVNTFAVKPPIILRQNGYNAGVGNFSFDMGGGHTRQVAGIADWSESMFAANRGVIDAKSRILTWAMSLEARVIQGIYTLTSKGGASEVDDSPNERSQLIPLDSDKDEELKLLEMASSGRDLDKILAAVLQEAARGGLLDPSDIAGANPSGRALRIMSQILREKLAPHERAVKDVLEAAAEALLAQYETGRYKPLTVVGVSRSLEPFNREIKPEDIKDHGPIQIELVPILPEDDFERIQMAQLASTPGSDGMPLLSRRHRNSRILRLQDVELETRRLMAEKAVTLTPLLTLAPLLEVAKERQDEAAFMFILDEMNRLHMQQQMEDFARQQAFAGALDQSGVDQAAAGVDPSSSNGTGTPRSPTKGFAPESAPLSGQPIARQPEEIGNTGLGV